MSRYDYEQSKVIATHGFTFHGLLMAAMRQADSENVARLRMVFPEVHAELDARYNAPGGYVEGDPEYAEYTEWRNAVTEAGGPTVITPAVMGFESDADEEG